MPDRRKGGYTKQERDRAFELYCEGVTYEGICDEIGCNRKQTIADWKERYGWEKRREEREKKARRRADNKAADKFVEAVERHFNLTQGVTGLINLKLKQLVENAQAEKNPVLPSAVELRTLASALHMAITTERLCMGLSTDNRELTGKDGKDLIPAIKVIESDIKEMLDDIPVGDEATVAFKKMADSVKEEKH